MRRYLASNEDWESWLAFLDDHRECRDVVEAEALLAYEALLEEGAVHPLREALSRVADRVARARDARVRREPPRWRRLTVGAAVATALAAGVLLGVLVGSRPGVGDSVPKGIGDDPISVQLGTRRGVVVDHVVGGDVEVRGPVAVDAGDVAVQVRSAGASWKAWSWRADAVGELVTVADGERSWRVTPPERIGVLLTPPEATRDDALRLARAAARHGEAARLDGSRAVIFVLEPR